MELTEEAKKIVEKHAKETTFKLLSVMVTAALAIIGLLSWSSIQTLVDNVAFEAKDELRKNYQSEASKILEEFESKLVQLDSRLNDVNIGIASELHMRRLLDKLPKHVGSNIESSEGMNDYLIEIRKLKSELNNISAQIEDEITEQMNEKVVSIETAANVSSGANYLISGNTMINWGRRSTSIAGYNKVTFAKEFGSDDVTVSATANDNVSYVDIKNVTKSGFEYQFTRPAKFSNYSQAGGEVHFFAAGKL